MSNHFSILITDDPKMGEAVGLIGEWASMGLVSPFISLDADRLSDGGQRRVGLLWDLSGQAEVDIFQALGEQEYRMIRVVALAGEEIADSDRLGELVSQVHSELDELSPPGMRTADIRMWHPLRRSPLGGDHPATPGLFSPHADANLVVIPEDRYRSDTLAAPIASDETPGYLEHVAVETAGALGLWVGMSVSPVDQLEKGVLGFGEPKLHLARSFVRIAQVDSPRLGAAFDHLGRIPVPMHMVGSPYPDAAVKELAAQIEERILAPFRFHPAPAETPSGWWSAVARVALGCIRFLGHLPRWMFDLPRKATNEWADRAMPESRVSSAPPMAEKGASESDPNLSRAEAISADAAARFEVEGGAVVDQENWKAIGDVIMATADGGEMPEGMQPPLSQTRRAVITDLQAVSPLPEGPRDQTGQETERFIEEVKEDTQTLIGRIDNALARIIAANRRGLEESKIRFEAACSGLGKRQASDMRLVALVFGGLTILLLGGLVLATGWVETVGIVSMNGAQRTLAWGVISGFFLTAIVAIAILTHHLQDETHVSQGEAHEFREALIKVASVAGGVALAVAMALGISRQFVPADAVGIGVGAGLVTLEVGLLWTFRSTPVFAKVLRRFTLVTIAYAVIGLIGKLARQYGWYGQVDASDRLLWIGIPTAAVGVVLLGLWIVSGWWVGREEHGKKARAKRVVDAKNDIVRAVHKEKTAQEAREQFVGSAIGWAEILWRPFGPSAEPRGDHAAQPMSVRKGAVNLYRMSRGWTESIREAWVQQTTRPGWISAQHGKAVRDFQKRFAGGLTSQTSRTMPPDQDPRVVSQLPVSERSGTSLRWRFVSALRSGEHDRVLAKRLQEIQDLGDPEWILNEIDNLKPVGGGRGPLAEFLGSILPRLDSEAHYVYFQQKALSGGELDRTWRSQIWLPGINLPEAEEGVEFSLTENGLLRDGIHGAIGVRHDLAGPYPATALFHDAGPASEEVEDSLDSDTPPVL